MITVLLAVALIAVAAYTGWWWLIPVVSFVVLTLWIRGADILADADLPSDFWGDDE